MGESMSEQEQVCPGCGKVHDDRDMDEARFIETNIDGLVDALRELMVEEQCNPKLAIAIAVGTAMQLAVMMRNATMNQHGALRELAEDVAMMCEKHIAMIEAVPEAKQRMEQDHDMRKRRMRQIEEMLEQSEANTELLMSHAKGSA